VPKLIFKLQRYGISGNLLACLQSLLSNRSFSVRVGNSFSPDCIAKSGVPQGSVLGPVLFALFINDLIFDLPHEFVAKLFADDVKAFKAFSGCFNESEITLFLSHVSSWSKIWQLPLSISKCSWMSVSNKHFIPDSVPALAIDSIPLTQVDETLDLGVLFNSHLNFADHINSIVARAKQRVFLLKRTFCTKNVSALVKAFKAFVLPGLEYCSPVWNPSGVGDIIKIEAVQRSFTKALSCNLRNVPYRVRLNTLGLWSLEHGRLIADLVMFYKITHNLVHLNLSNCFSPITNSVTRGHSLRVFVKNCRTNTRFNFFAIKTARIWNTLNEKTVTAPSVTSFKNLLYKENLDSFLVFKS